MKNKLFAAATMLGLGAAFALPVGAVSVPIRERDAVFVIQVDSRKPADKVAFEAPRRWWEADLGLYGGISWTSRDINQIWYPSSGFNGKKGDRLDFTGFDADTTKKGVQDFDFIGNDAFSKDGAEIRVQVKAGETYVYLNTDHDKAAEFVLHLDGEVKVKEAFFEI